MFELHTTDLDITSGALEVTWCLDKDLLANLKKQKDPQVIISIVPLDRDGDVIREKEQRYMFPLRQMMGYISFRAPGKNKIFAYIENTKTDILELHSRKYETDIINWEGNYIKSITGYSEDYNEEDDEGNATNVEVSYPAKPHIEPFEVDVPAEYFGKEPSLSEKEWVLWLINDKGVDQCAFRRRRIFAYTVQPFIMLLNWGLRLLLTLCSLLLGLRGLSLKPLLNPLTYDLPDSFHGLFSGGTIFIRPAPKKWENRDTRSFKELALYLLARGWSLPFMPPIAWFLYELTVHSKWLQLGIGAAILLVAFLFVLFMMNVVGIVDAFASWFENKILQIGGENNIEDLICTGEPVMRRPKNRSLKLRYLALKSKVCKPFAG